VAGDSISGLTFQCARMPVAEALSSDLYASVDMTPYRDTLARIFPEGVCDYSKPDLADPGELPEYDLAEQPVFRQSVDHHASSDSL